MNFGAYIGAYIIGSMLFICAGCATQSAERNNFESKPPTKDKYSNFEDLAAKENLGLDYKITLTDRNSESTVFAIHGGNIESGTSMIAKELAGDDYNLYLFEGIKPNGNTDLHVTSSRFDEPQAVKIASVSAKCLSIHGYKNSEARICLGGGDEILKSKICNALAENNFPFQIDLACPGLEGTHKNNIVNLCSNRGVQLEFSTSLRKKLQTDSQLLSDIAKKIRESVKAR